MKPWIHPQERRSRIYWWSQITAVVVLMVAGPIILLREPTSEHVLIAAAFVGIGAIVLFLAIKALRKLPEEHRYEAEEDESS